MGSPEMSGMVSEGKSQHPATAPAGAGGAAGGFLRAGIERWGKEGRLEATEARELRGHLSSGQVQNALRHLGVHMVLSVPVSIPGLQNLARLAWTAACWVGIQVRRFRYRAAGPGQGRDNIHSPLVMVLCLVPVLGSLAYLAARPIRNALLIRLALDQVAWKLPFGLYTHMGLGRWFAPVRVRDV